MGRVFGRARRAGIATLYEKRLDNALRQARAFGAAQVSEGALLGLARACAEITQRFDPEGFRELEGIAAGCGQPVEEVLTMNGLTDLRDALAWGAAEAEGCTSVMVPPRASETGAAFAGQTWDLATDNAPHVLAVAREPSNAPRTYTVTTEGCLSLMGINDLGVAVGTTNLRTRDARPGVPYLSLIHRALRCESAEEAAQQIEGATRAGAHFYYLLDSSGALFALECTARRSRRLRLSASPFVQCNHCQAPAHQSSEADTPERSSRARMRRMRDLIAGRSAPLRADHLREAFADGGGGPLAICRDDFSGISTNAAVVLEPGANKLHACLGLPDRAPWFEWVGASAGFDVSS
jgi:isopenicillin-N N-acyltransferase-like protein